MSSCPEDSSRAPEILFAEPWIHHPLGFGFGFEVQVLRRLGWAGLCHKQQSLMGSLFFLIKNVL